MGSIAHGCEPPAVRRVDLTGTLHGLGDHACERLGLGAVALHPEGRVAGGILDHRLLPGDRPVRPDHQGVNGRLLQALVDLGLDVPDPVGGLGGRHEGLGHIRDEGVESLDLTGERRARSVSGLTLRAHGVQSSPGGVGCGHERCAGGSELRGGGAQRGGGPFLDVGP